MGAVVAVERTLAALTRLVLPMVFRLLPNLRLPPNCREACVVVVVLEVDTAVVS